jgi:4-hydroxy-4-methyl-2-oxoglutarate aldolase
MALTYQLRPMPPSIDPDVLAMLAECETATLGHWRLYGFCDGGLRPLVRGRRIAGTAVTVTVPEFDGTMLHYAVDRLRPGDILCVDRLGDRSRACWGGGVTLAAQRAGAAGAIVDGPITDRVEIEAVGFAMWTRGEASRTTKMVEVGGRFNFPVSIGGVVVNPGDAILADDSGIVVLAPEEAMAEATRAIETQERGRRNEAQVASGAVLLSELSKSRQRVEDQQERAA